MKKIVLMAMLIAVSSTAVYAETSPAAADNNTLTPAPTQAQEGNADTDPANNVTPTGQAPVSTQVQDTSSSNQNTEDSQPPPATTDNMQSSDFMPTENADQNTQETDHTLSEPAKIDCSLSYPADQKHIPVNVIQQWGEYAAVKAFTMQANQIDTHLSELEKCFTADGWKGFKDALDKSGNLQTIKNENLDPSAKVAGSASTQVVKEDQWTVSVPVDVNYKNEKTHIDQHLKVNLVITRKADGGFGLVQIIAAPLKDIQQIQKTIPADKPADSVTPHTDENVTGN